MDNLFILESHIGEHHEVDKRFLSDNLSFAFIPIVNSFDIETKDLRDFSSFFPKKINPIFLNGLIIDIPNLSLFVNNYTRIYIGFDLDIMGNSMARVLHDYLIKNGFKGKIIRIPLTHQGFKYVGEFWNDELMNWHIKYMQEEMEFVNHSKKALGSFGAGRRTALISNELLNNTPTYVENINPNGTSSVTYIVKKKLKEKSH